jgi:hypothetical protein
LLGCFEILGRIHAPKDVVGGNTPVERGNQAPEAFLTDRGINFVLFHVAPLQSGFLEELSRDIAHRPVLSVDGIVQVAHRDLGDFA